MSYTVKLYIDSGYTAGNRPDSPSRLEADSTVITLSNKARVVQDYFLVQITLNLKNSSNIEVDPAHVDFMKVGSYYYKVTGSDWKTPGKACTFYLSMEYLLSRGGISTIAFISGIVRRYNVTSDDFGAYCIDDPYTAPAEPLVLNPGTVTNTAADTMIHYVCSSIELVTQGLINCFAIPITNDKTGTDQADLDPIVFYKTIPVPFSTKYGIGSDTTKDVYKAGTALYRIEGNPTTLQNKAVFGGIDAARQIGAEGAIVASYQIPSRLTSGTGSETDTFFTFGGGAVTNPYYSSGGQTSASIISNAKNTHVPLLYGKIGGSLEAGDADWEVACAIYDKDKYGADALGFTVQFFYVERLAGVDGEVSDYGCPLFIYNSTHYSASNKRVYYGSYTPYVLATVAGNQKQYNAETIYNSGSTSPKVMQLADVRPDGTVYYNFQYVNRTNLALANSTTRWGNQVESLQWDNVPLTYTDVSGGKLKAQQFSQARASSDLAYNQATRGWLNSKIMSIGDKLGIAGNEADYAAGLGGVQALAGITGQVAGNLAGTGAGITAAAAGTAGATGEIAGGLAAGGVGGWGAGAAAAGIGTAAGIAAGVVAVGAGVAIAGAYKYAQLNKTRETYLLERANETSQYLSDTNVAVPTLSFPQDMEVARQYYGEHPIVYRYQYTDNDLKRIDKILTMYGYRVCEPADVSMLSSHTAFNYFEGSVQVTNADGTEVMPQWMADGIAEELSSGVRLWHQRPIKITADCNPVKS